MLFISLYSMEDGERRYQKTSVPIPTPYGYAIVPKDILIPSSFPYVDIEVEGNIVTKMTALPVPSKPESKVELETISTEVTSGTYIGTGLYGEANPNTISPKTKSRILMILQNDETLLTLTRTDLTDEPFTWFRSSAKEQCNENGVVYNWIAVS